MDICAQNISRRFFWCHLGLWVQYFYNIDKYNFNTTDYSSLINSQPNSNSCNMKNAFVAITVAHAIPCSPCSYYCVCPYPAGYYLIIITTHHNNSSVETPFIQRLNKLAICWRHRAKLSHNLSCLRRTSALRVVFRVASPSNSRWINWNTLDNIPWKNIHSETTEIQINADNKKSI